MKPLSSTVKATKSRRLKLEFYDNEGVRHSITIDGVVTREKVARILDLVELMSGTPQPSALGLSPHKFDRLAGTILRSLNGKDFTSREAKRTFEVSFGEKIPLSTVSTYLSRLVDKGVLERRQQARFVLYRVSHVERPLVPQAPNSTVSP